MKVGLFIPCYVDQFYPSVAKATLELLEKLECDVYYPIRQTCCGQPMANAGFSSLTKACDKNFVRNFSECDYIVGPSGSCVLHIKEHLYDEENIEESLSIRCKIFELSEFLIDVLLIDKLNASFPFRVGLHTGCHGQRMLHLSSMSERVEPAFSKVEQLLVQVKGMTREDAYQLLSVSSDVDITQLVDGKKGVHGMIAKSIFHAR